MQNQLNRMKDLDEGLKKTFGEMERALLGSSESETCPKRCQRCVYLEESALALDDLGWCWQQEAAVFGSGSCDEFKPTSRCASLSAL